MSEGPVRSLLQSLLYLLNVGVVCCLLGAAFFLSQGLFGDLYACNESAVADVESVSQAGPQLAFGGVEVCIVDLNYTATPLGDSSGADAAAGEPASYFALQVMLPCKRIVLDEGNGSAWTDICFNRYKPSYFASVGPGGEGGSASYTHADAQRDLHTGVRAALWTALLGMLASWLHSNLGRAEARLEQLGAACEQGWKHARARAGAWRRRVGERLAAWRRPVAGEGAPPPRESEMQRIV